MKFPRKLLASIAMSLAIVLGLGATSPAIDLANSQSSNAIANQNQNPMIWGQVIRIVTTKTACENLLRVMPNKSKLKCMKAGKVWVVVPR